MTDVPDATSPSSSRRPEARVTTAATLLDWVASSEASPITAHAPDWLVKSMLECSGARLLHMTLASMHRRGGMIRLLLNLYHGVTPRNAEMRIVDGALARRRHG